jgi:hypothetical protein
MFRRERSYHQVSVCLYTEYERLQVVASKHREEGRAPLMGIRVHMNDFIQVGQF